nr:EAL domain-containing protein [uncultured Desulfobulbus sp.]
MKCEKCTTTPDLLQGPCLVFVSASHVYMLDKLAEIFDATEISFKRISSYIQVHVDDYAVFIRSIGAERSISAIEKANIHLLPLVEGEVLDFGKFATTRTLESWYTLYNAEDLIWILENNTITVLFQPIVRVADMSIYAYECLARGVKENGDLQSPLVMFETAKKTDLLFNLDRQCREASIRIAAQKKIQRNIFVNFLPSAIYNPVYCLQDTVRWSKKLNYDPLSIVFEVVETEKVTDTQHLIKILRFYKEKGFRTALDDMGNGYSSLSLFVTLHPDIVKIDMDLIRDVHKNEVKQTVVKALIAMAKEVGTSILAEGVETAEEFSWLQEKGIDFVQGYYFSKPSAEPVLQV